MRSSLLLSLWAVAGLVCSSAQPAPVKRTADPPVILLNGYQLICSATPVDSTDTFGNLEALLVASGREVRFFDNCLQGRVSIESLGQSLGQYLASLTYDDGTPVPQVDLIAHSMGGLIARCYLSGRKEDGTYNPPFPKRVRKLISIGTPNFGAEFGVAAPDRQAAQMIPGTRLLYDLATWNQYRDDLRGVDALAIAGRSHNRTGDGLVQALSASGYFAAGLAPDRTRVVSGCHTTGLGAILLSCNFNEPGIANINNADHPSWQLINGFLSPDPASWNSLFSAADDSELSTQASLWVTYANAQGSTLAPVDVTGSLNGAPLSRFGDSPVLFASRTPQREDAQLELTIGGQANASIPLTLSRGVRVTPLKEGLTVTSVDSVSAAYGVYGGSGRVLTSDAPMQINGTGLTSVTDILLDEMPLTASAITTDSGAIQVQVPPRPPGIARLRVLAPGGEHSSNLVFGIVPARIDTLSAESVNWNPIDGASGYALWIGTAPGQRDLFESPILQDLSVALPSLPADNKLYIRLWTQYDGDWYYRDSQMDTPSHLTIIH